MAQQPDQRIVGHNLVEVVGLLPRQDLQNIIGDNWAAPPWTCVYVTYCYLKDPSSNTEVVARKLGTTLPTC